MRIDLPYCNFNNCKYYFDGNCTLKIEFDRCRHDYLELKEYKYKWHDLRKNPEDLPELHLPIIFADDVDDITACMYGYYNGMEWYEFNNDDRIKHVIAWRLMEAFGEDEE